MPEQTEEVRVDVMGGKYTVVLGADGRAEVLRYGEKWPTANPPGTLVVALACELAEVRAAMVAKIRGDVVAVRHSFDGHGWQYDDAGNGSDWLERAMRRPDAELLVTGP